MFDLSGCDCCDPCVKYRTGWTLDFYVSLHGADTIGVALSWNGTDWHWSGNYSIIDDCIALVEVAMVCGGDTTWEAEFVFFQDGELQDNQTCINFPCFSQIDDSPISFSTSVSSYFTFCHGDVGMDLLLVLYPPP